jgi:hypothetical protein
MSTVPLGKPRPIRPFEVDDLVEVRIVRLSRLCPGTYTDGDMLVREWRPGTVVKVTRSRVTVDCPSHRNRPQTRYAAIPFIYVRHREAAPTEVRS